MQTPWKKIPPKGYEPRGFSFHKGGFFDDILQTTFGLSKEPSLEEIWRAKIKLVQVADRFVNSFEYLQIYGQTPDGKRGGVRPVAMNTIKRYMEEKFRHDNVGRYLCQIWDDLTDKERQLQQERNTELWGTKYRLRQASLLVTKIAWTPLPVVKTEETMQAAKDFLFSGCSGGSSGFVATKHYNSLGLLWS